MLIKWSMTHRELKSYLTKARWNIIYIYVIMKTMHRPAYHGTGFVVSHGLGHIMTVTHCWYQNQIKMLKTTICFFKNSDIFNRLCEMGT